MLRKEQNDLVTQSGPGTAMGRLFRSYWTPVLLAAELPENDGPPVRVKILSERLIAFRDTAAPVWWTNTAPTAARRSSSAATRRAVCAVPTTAGNST